MLSHMQTMSGVFQSRGDVLTWMRTSAGAAARTAPSRARMDTGARQQAQYDSSRISLPANGGMREIAIDSIAHPAQQWNFSPRYTATWLGKLENGCILRMFRLWARWSSVMMS